MTRVVITGIGILSPAGNDTESTWTSLVNGRSGTGDITRFYPEPSAFPSRIAGELKGFHAEDHMPKKDVLRLDPFIHYAAAASTMALDDSGIMLNRESADRAGVVIGSSRGGITSMERAMERHLIRNRSFSAYLMSSSTINMAPSYVSMRFCITGPSIGISTACSSGTTAIGEACRMIKSGCIDWAIAGGAEAPVCRTAVGGYGASGALSRRNHEPEKASRPFDRFRDGFVISEGAGIVVLEKMRSAQDRGADIYAEIAGYGTCSDAFHQTRPDSRGEARAIVLALKDAGLDAEDIGLINAHATSTVLGDRAEAEAIQAVFGDRSKNVPVSSCKSVLGHMLGGAGAVETAATALTLSREVIVPTINLDETDPRCGLNHVTAPLKRRVDAALTHSFGFGGVNAVLVLKRFYGE